MRVRKRARIRSTLVDAAVSMCLSEGYENTTVERICAAVEVSPRTFARYFPSKDAVFVAVLDELAEEVATALRVLPNSLGPMAAMRAALEAILTRAHRLRFHGFSAERIVRIVRVVTASEALRQAAIRYRGPQVVEAMADRMNVGVEDRRLALVMELISVTVLHAWSGVAASDLPLNAETLAREVDRAFAQVGTLAGTHDTER